MQEKASFLNDFMQASLHYLKQRWVDIPIQLQSSFQIAIIYCRILKKDLKNYQFENMEAEIRFFKKTMPQFLSEIEYFNLRYQSQLFASKKRKEELPDFWKQEILRLDAFVNSHSQFCRYYRNNDSENDKEWFVRQKSQKNIETPQVRWVACLFALERYDKYIKDEELLL